MTCDEVLPLLNLLADDALASPEAARILEHLKECNGCQGEWDSILAVRSKMRGMRDAIDVPAGLMLKVGKAIERENKQPAVAPAISWISGMPTAMVAGLVLLIALGSFLVQYLNSGAVPVDVDVL